MSKDPRNKAVNQIPIVLQYNKQDELTALSIAELHERFNVIDWPEVSAIARQGIGVQETFETLCVAIGKALNEKAINTFTLEWENIIDRIVYSARQEENMRSMRNSTKIMMMFIVLVCIVALIVYIFTQ